MQSKLLAPARLAPPDAPVHHPLDDLDDRHVQAGDNQHQREQARREWGELKRARERQVRQSDRQRRTGAGRYTLSANVDMEGDWKVRVDVSAPGETLSAEFNVTFGESQ